MITPTASSPSGYRVNAPAAASSNWTNTLKCVNGGIDTMTLLLWRTHAGARPDDCLSTSSRDVT
jgi:hypothetical protein